MRCARCGAENRPGRRFCSKCGAPLAVTCPACGFANEPDDEFCGGCGARLQEAPTPQAPAAVPGVPTERQTRPATYTPKHLAEKILKGRSALEGERRQVTVLFADVAGFTALAEKLDPEDVHRIMDRCFELVTTEVHRLEGTINQYTGDGVMALFGAPIAHEDGARRAVHAALGIQRALRDFDKELQRQKPLSLRMRIGMNTGPVVVGRIGDDLRMDYTAVGDTTNLAARLQQNARPGSIVVGEATHKLIARYFETLDLGELAVKGHAPVKAFEVVRARGRTARLDVEAERSLTPLVGRARELSVLLDLYQKVKDGRGQVLFVAGEPGIGKSRLLLECRRRLAEAREQATWLEGRCISFGQSIPFLPMIDQLRENFRIEEHDGEPEIIAKVEHGMRRMGGLEPHIPYIRYLLAVDPGDPAISVMDAAARRKRIFEANRALALRGATLRPLVLVHEDLHWIDSTSEEYLASLMDSVAGIPLLLIATYRVGYTPPFGTRSFHTTLTLGSLSEAESVHMAERVLGTERFPEELKAALMRKAEGVPLFIEEVAKTLLDLGVLRREDGGYRMAQGITDVSVPDTIHDIIMARLDRLGEQGKRTVQLASVIGRQFMRRLLERVGGLTGQLEGLLAELKALEIIYEQGLLIEPAYVFKHAVIQDVAYNSLLRERRRELHRTVGQAIEDLYADRLAEHYEELAHHFALAEEWPKAMDYSVRAADRAAHAFANAEATKHYTRALEVAQKITPPLGPAALAELHVKRAVVLNLMAEYEEAAGEYQRALELSRQAGDRRQELAVLVGLTGVYNWYHKPDAALRSVNEALASARAIEDRGAQAGCLAMRAEVVAASSGQVTEVMADLDEAVRLSRQIGDPKLLAHTLTFAGRNLAWRGEFDRAIAYLEEGTELARREHLAYFMALGLYSHGHARLARGEYEQSLRLYRELGEYADAAGDKLYIVRVPNCLGGVYLDVWNLEQSIELNQEGDDMSKRLWPWPEPRGHALLKLGLSYLYRDEHARAESAFLRALDLFEVDSWGRWTWYIPLVRARGELALAERRLEDAWRFASEAFDLAARSGRSKHMARAQRVQGEVLAAGGRLDEAVRMLEGSVRIAEAIKAPREAWLGEAALGGVLARLGRDRDAETMLTRAVDTIESMTVNLTTPTLRRSFLAAEPVTSVYRTLGRRPPENTPRQ